MAIVTFCAGGAYMVWIIYELLQPRLTVEQGIAAAILFPVTLLLTPFYAAFMLNDWRLLAVGVSTVVLTALLSFARRNFARS
jgi:hypothetical protein